jgi:hypothetical protein
MKLSPNNGSLAERKPLASWDVYAALCIGKYDFAYDCVHTLFRPSAVVIYSKHAQGVSDINDLQFHFFESVGYCLFMLMWPHNVMKSTLYRKQWVSQFVMITHPTSSTKVLTLTSTQGAICLGAGALFATHPIHTEVIHQVILKCSRHHLS